ncbi:MAG: ABC transporter substrate-binding protein [Sporomusaceae bacterium]|nr:ABC transporter substrate-binding protein [Sporomusaceae bacterium]
MKKMIGVISLSILMLFNCSCQKSKAAKINEIFIPIVGNQEYFEADPNFLNGVEMAVREFNEKYESRGYILKIQKFYDNSNYETGVSIATQLASDPKVTAIINAQDFNILNATAEILNNGNKIVLMPYGSDESVLKKGYQNVFRNTFGATDMGRAMGQYVINKGFSRIVVAHSDTEFENIIAKSFGATLLNTQAKIVDYVPKIMNQDDFNKFYDRWSLLSADCIIITQYDYAKAFEINKMVREKGKNMAVVGDFSFDIQGQISLYKDYVDGIVIPVLFPVTYSDKLNGFQAKYNQTYGEKPNLWASHGYDSVRMIADTAIKLESIKSEVITKALKSPEGYDGLSGKIIFDSEGNFIGQETQLKKLINGKFELMNTK